MKIIKTLVLTLTLTLTLASTQFLLAHGGRRLDVVVIDGKLAAQGYNSGDFDRADFVRPYLNSIHNHWQPGANVTGLPGFDVTFADSFTDENGVVHAYGYNNQARLLEGFDLNIELTGAGKWTSPTTESYLATSLAANESIGIDYRNASIDTTDLSTGTTLAFALVDNWSSALNRIDLDPDYTLNLAPEPAGSLYFLEWQLTSENPAIAASDSVYTIFAPPSQVHAQALALEQTLGTSPTSVPEPSSVVLLGLGVACLARRHRQR